MISCRINGSLSGILPNASSTFTVRTDNKNHIFQRNSGKTCYHSGIIKAHARIIMLDCVCPEMRYFGLNRGARQI
jgi:hypothetical protein